jgi:hypothetical protein
MKKITKTTKFKQSLELPPGKLAEAEAEFRAQARAHYRRFGIVTGHLTDADKDRIDAER